MNLEHGDNHRSGNAERGDAAQESDDQAETAEELRGDRKIRERNGNSELIVESTNGRAQTMTAEPTEKFLRAVRKKKLRQGPCALASAPNRHRSLIS